MSNAMSAAVMYSRVCLFSLLVVGGERVPKPLSRESERFECTQAACVQSKCVGESSL